MVAYRDISPLNIMMDPYPLYPELYHPCDDYMSRDYSRGVKPYTRTERPTKYYFIDFGLSRKYNMQGAPASEMPILGGDKSVPEFQGDGYYRASDPFPTDVYYLGNRFREEFLQVSCSLSSRHCRLTRGRRRDTKVWTSCRTWSPQWLQSILKNDQTSMKP